MRGVPLCPAFISSGHVGFCVAGWLTVGGDKPNISLDVDTELPEWSASEGGVCGGGLTTLVRL